MVPPIATDTATTVPTATPSPTATVNAAATATEKAAATATARAIAAVLDRLTRTALQPQYIFYTVQPGDTVVSIAQRFHDAAWLIRRRNGGLWYMAPGQTIRVWQWPFGAPYYVTHTYLTDRPQVYTIKAGDTAGAIATRLGTTLATLAAENGLGSANLIYPGQKLMLHHYSAHKQPVLVPGVPSERLHTGLLLTDVANLVGTDAALVKALSWHESGWRMVRGSSGEIGMMQIMPATARWIQSALVGYNLDPSIPVNNALEGTLLLQYYLDVRHGDTHAALALYHSGNTRANLRNGSYIRPILSLRRYFYRYPRAGW
jgi:LysM repeat protein